MTYFLRDILRQPEELRRTLDVKVAAEVKVLDLYPQPFDYVFGANLHFVALWERAAK